MKKYFMFCLFITSISSSFVALSDEEEVDCDNASTTYEMNYCLRVELKAADEKLDYYIKEARVFYSDRGSMADTIETTYQKWTEYRFSYCSAVGAVYAGGTISGVMYYACMTNMSYRFINNFWDDFIKGSIAQDKLPKP